MTKKLDQDLIGHACEQLGKIARRHVREGMGPESAARAAIRETKALFPPDWKLGVQGDDSEEQVEVWEVDDKYQHAIARIRSAAADEPPPKLSAAQRALLRSIIIPKDRDDFSASQRRTIEALFKRGLMTMRDGRYHATEAGLQAYYHG